LAVLAVLAGCGGGPGTLSGKVLFRNKPVVYGTVMVVGADGITRSGNIEPDGTYTVADVPAGPVKIGVVSPEPPDPKKAARRDDRTHHGSAALPPIDRSRWFRIPDKYGDLEHSGLTATVRSGATPFDIHLP
jgi:hypothetical protein